MDQVKLYVGLDVHKDSIAIAFARAHSRDDPQFVGTTRYSVISLTKALSKLGTPSDISICHEAGPCGYGLVRALREQGYHCEVVAPSRVARRPADRIKTDRRDALLLARLHRAGELVPVAVPEPQDEAIRDLVRARENAVNDLRMVRQRLKSFLLRHGHAYTGSRWGPKHELFLSKIKFENSAQHIVFTEYRMAVRFATELVERLTQSLRAHAETWRWLPTVKGLMTLRSIDFISALTIVAELGDLRRFPHPREFMGYLGLVPSEHSSGNTKQRGGLTRRATRTCAGYLSRQRGIIGCPQESANRYRLGSKDNLDISSTSPGKRRFGSATDFVGFAHEVSIRTRRVRQSRVNYADSSGISERDCSQPEHLSKFSSTYLVGSCYRKTSIFHLIGNAAPGAMWGTLEIFL